MDSKVVKHFQKVDLTLYKTYLKILKKQGEFPVRKKLVFDQYFNELVESIISQQLSVKAADTIYNRVKSIFPQNKITPGNILKTTSEAIWACGLSNSKVSFIKDLSQKIIDKQLDLKKLDSMDDENIKETLMKIKGIGPWTVEMFLMFSLQRKDIFSHGDLGLKNALKKLYYLDNPSKEDLEKIIGRWSPYKTSACKILWKSLDL
ncbi:hypothetical protein A2780_01570 [Candidatus Daviesbacteria bacterium RIFCSPHIGHO2_01_FULL_41_45]|nr:MAG: hypothetical protein A2780_01570 [Candidatus Daviesbacteria bacterium RIFCSPHIGHO2_01_FULL_41_45]